MTMKKYQISVLMSLYINEKTEYAKACFDSLLSQTYLPNEWVIVEDGPLTVEMYSLLDEYQNRYPSLIKRIPLRQNQGLGLALREGIRHCSNELIARMDTDDIARNDRFEKQFIEFQKDPLLDICGSQIKEFIGTPDNVVSMRLVPTTDAEIKKFQKYRTAFNHVTVMYKKSTVLKAGNYEHAPSMEDALLWAKMFIAGAKSLNINEALVYVRVGNDMYSRRTGINYIRNYMKGREQIYKVGYISYFEFIVSVIIRCIFALLPISITKIVYQKMLRK